MRAGRLWLAAALVAVALPTAAVTPAEQLADKGLEARAREISRGLRCPVCRNESIDESNADIAHDLRVLVRERLVAGDSDAEVVAAVVARYGDYILLSPRFAGWTAALWLAGPVLLLGGGAVAFLFLRRQRSTAPPEPLSAAEARRIEDLMAGRDG